MYSILVPVYNEAGNITAVFKHLQQVFPFPHEIIIINDGSTDQTKKEIKNFPCKTISLSRNKGKGNAVRLGIAEATGDYIGLIDGDGQDSPEELLQLFKKAQQKNADLAIGSRFIDHQTLGPRAILALNKVGNKAVTTLFNFFFRTTLSDVCASLRVFKASVVKTMPISTSRYEIEIEMLIRAVRKRFSIIEIPVSRFSRIHGKSNLYQVPLGRLRFGLRAVATLIRGFLFWR